LISEKSPDVRKPEVDFGEITRREKPEDDFGEITRREKPEDDFGEITRREKPTAYAEAFATTKLHNERV
jgi:hypothetical protein